MRRLRRGVRLVSRSAGIIPAFGTIEGPFQISSLDYRGDHATEVTFELALESAGALTFASL